MKLRNLRLFSIVAVGLVLAAGCTTYVHNDAPPSKPAKVNVDVDGGRPGSKIDVNVSKEPGSGVNVDVHKTP